MKYEDLTDVELKNLEAYSSNNTVTFYADHWTKVGLFTQEKKAFRKYLTKEGAKILDVGCGTGRTTYPLHKLGFDVIGIDISEPMIEKAKSTFPEVDFRVGNACELEFESEVFDYVLFSFNGIDCIFPEEKRLTAFREIHRVLRPGGIFVFSSHNSWYLIPDNPLGYFTLLKFLAWNIRKGKIFSTYKIDRTSSGHYVTYYFANPFQQKRQLEACGFRLLDMIGNSNGAARYLDGSPHYVAEKR
jgi:ubiquinone/menaquinone biosynthesis C-methylase UbiE